MERPKIKVKRTRSDNVFVGITIISIVTNCVLVAFYYPQLPEEIARHFNAAGVADGFGNKSSIVVLPALSSILSVFMLLLCHIPQSFNYPIVITSQNAEIQYAMAAKMLRLLTMIMALMFLDTTYQSIQVAMENQEGLKMLSILLYLILMVVILVGYYRNALKNK